MNTKSDVVRIVYAPPEAPAARVKYRASQAASVVTPTRKRRTYISAASKNTKRRVAGSIPAQAEHPPTLKPENGINYTNNSFNPREPNSNEFIGGAYLEDGAECRTGQQPDELLSPDEAKFMFFVEAVSSD